MLKILIISFVLFYTFCVINISYARMYVQKANKQQTGQLFLMSLQQNLNKINFI